MNQGAVVLFRELTEDTFKEDFEEALQLLRDALPVTHAQVVDYFTEIADRGIHPHIPKTTTITKTKTIRKAETS